MILLDRHDALDAERYRRIVEDGEPVALSPQALELVDRRRAAMLRAIDYL